MTIQFNTDRNVSGNEAVTSPLKDMIADGLSRFSNQITRIEAHLSDENGDKDTGNDKRCVLEARIQGLNPIAVTNNANTHELAVEGAIEKLTRTIDKTLEKLSDH